MSSRSFFPTVLRVADVALWLSAAAALVALYLVLWQPAGQAATLKVMLNNETMQELSLSVNQTVSVEGALGASELEINNGRVRFLSSPCRNQVCVHHGWANHRGELLACLPNRIALVLDGNANAADIDAVNF